jgi:amino acid transporter
VRFTYKKLARGYKMDDIPKGIILVLLIITVLISVLGTWTVLDQVNSMRAVQPTAGPKSSATAQVGITIIDPDAPRAVREPSLATGRVSLMILNPEEAN